MITAEEIRSVLDYCPDTGVFRWKVSVHGSRGKGAVAGYNRGKYWGIAFRKKTYCAHRLVWLHVHGRWPVDVLDHINRDGFDNRLVNLREATPSLNQANRARPNCNTSGFKGVSRRTDGKAWCASVRKEGKDYRLGFFASAEDAAAAYNIGAIEHFGEFAQLNKI